jgi:hypothetical protein
MKTHPIHTHTHTDMPILSFEVDDPTDFTYADLLLEIGRLTCMECDLVPSEYMIDDIVSIQYSCPNQHEDDDDDEEEGGGAWIMLKDTAGLRRAIGECEEQRCIEVTANIVVSTRPDVDGPDGGDGSDGTVVVGSSASSAADGNGTDPNAGTPAMSSSEDAAMSSEDGTVGSARPPSPSPSSTGSGGMPETPPGSAGRAEAAAAASAGRSPAAPRTSRPAPLPRPTTGGDRAPTPRLSNLAVDILKTADSLRGMPGGAVSRRLVGLLLGTLHTGSGQFSTGLRELREAGLLVVDVRPPRFTVTSRGVEALLERDARLPAHTGGEKVRDRVREVLLRMRAAKGHERKIARMFGALANGETLSRDQLASAAAVKSLKAGPAVTALKVMLDCGVVEYPGTGLVRMADEMFPFGRPRLS